jgi:hypothetical protein
LQEAKAKNHVPSPGQGTSLGITQGISLLTSPFNPGTPLNTIPPSFSYSSSQIVYFDGIVVSMGYYVFRKYKRGITKRESKRQNIEETPNK